MQASIPPAQDIIRKAREKFIHDSNRYFDELYSIHISSLTGYVVIDDELKPVYTLEGNVLIEKLYQLIEDLRCSICTSFNIPVESVPTIKRP